MLHKGINQDITQELNRSLLLKNLRKEGNCSRAHLAELTGLKQATVTNIMKDFIYWGLVDETGFLNGHKGRRSIGVSINNEKYRTFGIRLSRKYYKIGVFDLSGHLVEDIKVTIPHHPDTQKIIDEMCSAANQYIQKYSSYEFLAVGIALPGPFIAKKNKIALLVGAEEWEDINIKECFEKELKLPVFLEHDSNAGAFSHMWDLKDSYHSEILIYFSVGPGIGAGIIIDNELYTGTLGIAGEIGHTSIDVHGLPCPCGNRGCLDLYASSTALLQNINQAMGRNNGSLLTLTEVTGLIAQNDPVCIKCFTEACEYLGYSIANVVNMINPDIIIIGDEMSKIAPKLMEDIIKTAVKSRILPELWDNLTIEISKGKKDAMLTGAAIVAINHIFENPGLFINT